MIRFFLSRVSSILVGFTCFAAKILPPFPAAADDRSMLPLSFLKIFLHFLLRAVSLRAEEAGRNPALRAAFDVVTARAVAELNVLAEYSLPLLQEGGFFLALKGPEPQEELAAAAHALELLGGTVEQVLNYSLPSSREGRSVVVIRKSVPTPEKYPRRPGMPSKRPL